MHYHCIYYILLCYYVILYYVTVQTKWLCIIACLTRLYRSSIKFANSQLDYNIIHSTCLSSKNHCPPQRQNNWSIQQSFWDWCLNFTRQDKTRQDKTRQRLFSQTKTLHIIGFSMFKTPYVQVSMLSAGNAHLYDILTQLQSFSNPTQVTDMIEA